MARTFIPQRFPNRLHECRELIHAEFRAHEKTIRQLAAEWRVGQETMRQFLMKTMVDYQDVVRELRQLLARGEAPRLQIMYQRLDGHLRPTREAVRCLRDFSEEELKEIQRRLEARVSEVRVSYHGYVVSPLLGDVG
jgi:hypothetical protein